jgi:uncharacterized protein YycO
MKNLLAALLLLSSCLQSIAQPTSALRDGDIVFQSNTSPTAQAIRLATHSQWNHCGIVFIEDGKPYVYEAVQPIRRISLEDWAAQGTSGKYAAKRLKAATTLDSKKLPSLKAATSKHLGKNYDLAFSWSDERMYCSELVWKAYERAAGIELGKRQKLRDFDLSHPLVQAKLKQRYGDKIPYDEEVISPEALWASPLLMEVK